LQQVHKIGKQSRVCAHAFFNHCHSASGTNVEDSFVPFTQPQRPQCDGEATGKVGAVEVNETAANEAGTPLRAWFLR
jgi:hypothetical protein